MVNLYDAARVYNHSNPGFGAGAFGAGGGVPDAAAQTAQMAKALHYAAASDLPESFQWGGGYLHLILAQLARPTIAPKAAQLMQQELLANPQAQPLVKSLEFVLATLAERSPETFQHILHHTALTMMAFEPLHGSIEEHKTEAFQALVGALGHDVGKLGLDPELLHKHTRLPERRFDYAVERYEKQVPDYPQKTHDLAFLRLAQRGLLVFCGKSLDSHAPATDETIALDQLQSSETVSTTDEQRQLHTRILVRIDAHAHHAITGAAQGEWLKPAEIMQLASTERGTLSATERAIIATHDPMSASFFAQQTLPEALKPLPDIVNMDAFRGKDGADAPKIAQLIHTTDVFEALTADRSYRPAYDVGQAESVMQAMAAKGEVPEAELNTVLQSGVLTRYAEAYGLPMGHAEAITPAQPSWVERVTSPEKQSQLAASR